MPDWFVAITIVNQALARAQMPSAAPGSRRTSSGFLQYTTSAMIVSSRSKNTPRLFAKQVLLNQQREQVSDRDVDLLEE